MQVDQQARRHADIFGVMTASRREQGRLWSHVKKLTVNTVHTAVPQNCLDIKIEYLEYPSRTRYLVKYLRTVFALYFAY